MMASPNRTVNHWLHQSRCSSPARHRESRAVLLASSTLELHHQKAALCAPPGTPSGRTAISWPRALHPGGCPLARGILIWPVVISYAYVGFMAISFPLLCRFIRRLEDVRFAWVQFALHTLDDPVAPRNKVLPFERANRKRAVSGPFFGRVQRAGRFAVKLPSEVHPIWPVGVAGTAVFCHLEGFDHYWLLAKFQVHLVLQKSRALWVGGITRQSTRTAFSRRLFLRWPASFWCGRVHRLIGGSALKGGQDGQSLL